MKLIHWQYLSASDRIKILKRTSTKDAEKLRDDVAAIVNDVKKHGDDAIRKYTKKFDNVILEDFRVTDKEFEIAEKLVSKEDLEIISEAASNIRKFHMKQLPQNYTISENGITSSVHFKPIDKIGIYLPGGNAPLVSKLLMLLIPAEIAGCKYRSICIPPNEKGQINPYLLAVADMLCHTTEIYKIGGPQAIAAMGFGTQSVKKVDKIFGPGNQYVTQAKLMVAEDPNGASYDMPAGPSEIMVIADNDAMPSFVASEILTKLEMNEKSLAVLVTTSQNIANAVGCELEKQISQRGDRGVATRALRNGLAIIVQDIDEAIDIANEYAPEILSLNVSNSGSYVGKINNAASVCLGRWTTVSAGDYATGANHILPSYGYAKSFGALSVKSYMKPVLFQQLAPSAVGKVSKLVESLATIEGLFGHRNAMKLRMKALEEENQ